jgi:hypothetical protein
MSHAPLPIGVEFTPVNFSSQHSFTDGEVASFGFTPCVTTPPGTPVPQPDNFWAVAGYKIADYITLWIYKRLGHLIIIGSIDGD